jgi:hypothetical protein
MATKGTNPPTSGARTCTDRGEEHNWVNPRTYPTTSGGSVTVSTCSKCPATNTVFSSKQGGRHGG